MSDSSEPKCNQNYGFIKKEEEILVKHEFDSCFQNVELWKYDESLEPVDGLTRKYKRETAWIEQTTSEIFRTTNLPKINTKDSSQVHDLIREEYRIKDEIGGIKHFAELQHALTLNVCEEQCNINNAEVKAQLEHSTIVHHVTRHSETLGMGELQPHNHNKYVNPTRYNSSAASTNILIKPKKTSINHNVCQDNAVEYFRKLQVEKLFKCGLCEYRSARKMYLVGHIRTHMGVKTFKCGQCDYSTITRNNLVRHIRRHHGAGTPFIYSPIEEKPFKCNLCEYRAPEKSGLVRHMLRHTEDKPFKCNLCDFSTLRKGTLVLHIRTHTGEKPFMCELCGFKGPEKFTLLRHIRTHTGEKPIKCALCDYSTRNNSDLARHLYTHTGEKPFKCDLCNYQSSEKAHLARHMRSHLGKNPIKCEMCDYSSFRKSDLKKHVCTPT